MIPDITPVSQIDWDQAGARFYHVPFTLDHTWGRVRVPVYVACSTQPGPTVLAIGVLTVMNTKDRSDSRISSVSSTRRDLRLDA